MVPRVLLADDHTMLLEAFAELLTPACEIVGKVANGRELLEAAGRLSPDVIVLDVMMPLLNGLDAGRQIKQSQPNIKLVYLTMNEDPDVVAEAFRVGASAFLLKRSAASELLAGIREAMNRRSYVTPLITEQLLGSLRVAPGTPVHHELTGRQREVLQLIAEGQSMKEAAATLNVTPRTIAFHKYQMMAQLKIRTTAELISFAIKQHLV